VPSALGLPASDLANWRAPQCVLVNDHSLFWVYHPLWLDALYFRFRPTAYFLTYGFEVNKGGVLYGTRLAMQGTHPRQNCSAMAVSDGGKACAYIQGVQHLARPTY